MHVTFGRVHGDAIRRSITCVDACTSCRGWRGEVKAMRSHKPKWRTWWTHGGSCARSLVACLRPWDRASTLEWRLCKGTRIERESRPCLHRRKGTWRFSVGWVHSTMQRMSLRSTMTKTMARKPSFDTTLVQATMRHCSALPPSLVTAQPDRACRAVALHII